jgi:hypothetical protein
VLDGLDVPEPTPLPQASGEKASCPVPSARQDEKSSCMVPKGFVPETPVMLTLHQTKQSPCRYKDDLPLLNVEQQAPILLALLSYFSDDFNI